MYSGLKITEPEPDAAHPGWAKASFVGQKEGAPIASFIHATIKGKFAVKIRITTEKAEDTAIPDFVAEVQRIVSAAHPQ